MEQIDLLWAQQDFIRLIVVGGIVAFYVLKFILDSRAAQREANKQQPQAPVRETPPRPDREPRYAPRDPTSYDVESGTAPPRRRRERPRTRPRGSVIGDDESVRNGDPSKRTALTKELAPQGAGARFDADPGTLDASSVVAHSIEPTVNPQLESMTGVFDVTPDSNEFPGQPLTFEIQELIARPEGVRQAIILAEILKRPEH